MHLSFATMGDGVEQTVPVTMVASELHLEEVAGKCVLNAVVE